VKSFDKCLAHDGTLERCVPFVPQSRAHLSCALNLLKFSLYLVLNENSNIVILKLWGVCRTQSCDTSCGLEVI
jgi:hypothetical protein